MGDLFDLTGKVAIVTGGAGGIGHALSLGIAERGADVVVASRQLGHLEEVAAEIHALGRQALPITVDVTQEQSVRRMVARILEMSPHIDILVNCAGIVIYKPAESFPIDEWQQVMGVNALGTFLCCQVIGRVMIKQGGGKIINFSSVRGRYGARAEHTTYSVAYSQSKGSVDTLTRALATEWAKYNVLVNAIAPTGVMTEFVRPLLSDPQIVDRMNARIPLGRLAMPDDLVGPTVFLASKASDYVTGQIIYVDGGLTASS